MDRQDKQSRAHPERSDDTLTGEEQEGYLRSESSTPREPGTGTTTYETTTRGDDYAAERRDEYTTPRREDHTTTQERDDFAAQAPPVPPSGPQREVSTEEAAERKAVQPSNQAAGAATATTTGQAASDQPGVLSREDAQAFQVRWEAIQTVFVDDPQAATEQADALVGEVMDRLLRLRQEYLTQLRGALGEGADTEAMRVALRRYRAFFNVLLGP